MISLFQPSHRRSYEETSGCVCVATYTTAFAGLRFRATRLYHAPAALYSVSLGISAASRCRPSRADDLSYHGHRLSSTCARPPEEGLGTKNATDRHADPQDGYVGTRTIADPDVGAPYGLHRVEHKPGGEGTPDESERDFCLTWNAGRIGVRASEVARARVTGSSRVRGLRGHRWTGRAARDAACQPWGAQSRRVQRRPTTNRRRKRGRT